jgi:N-acetylglucosamine kinase-like BadF-type ATPase
MNASVNHLDSLIRQIASIMEQESGTVKTVCIGSASILVESPDHWSVKQLSEAFPFAQVFGVIDSRIALEGALGGRPGVVVAAGTGSISYSMDVEGKMRRCGGWGPLIGDEGSGYWIGCESLRSVVKHRDGRGTATMLTERLLEKLQVQNDVDLINKVYGEMNRSEVASLAIETGICASIGDEEAIRILNEAGEHLADLAVAIARCTPLDSEPAITYAGGVFRLGELILSSFTLRLGEWRTALREPLHTPVYGAVLLARKQFGTGR